MKKIFVIAGLAILFMGWYFLFVKNKEVSSPKETKEDVEQQTLKGLEKSLGVTAEIRESEYLDWINNNGKSLPLSSKQIILGTNGTNGIGKYGDFTTDELNNVNPEFLNKLGEKIKKYYLENGFKESKSNTNTFPNDLWFLNLGFEKNGIYCVNNLAKQSDPFAYLSCGTVNDKQLRYMEEFKDVYKESKKEITGPVALIFRVQKVDRNYAMGSASSIGGWQWIARKSNNKWNVVWTGQDFPTCPDMKKYGVPPSIYEQCYNPVTQKVEK